MIPRVDDRYIELHDCSCFFFLVSALNLSVINILIIGLFIDAVAILNSIVLNRIEQFSNDYRK